MFTSVQTEDKFTVMINSAANSDYPKFVADQVLTSDNLNDLFGYLDEQGRLTRANLSGIGIVCGLEVFTAGDGSSIKITKGVGVTSSGYLVTLPEVTYTKRTTEIFDAVKSQYYQKFVNVSGPTQKFDLWELKQEAESEGTTALTKTFLTDGDKIVLIFVELLEENNKNCDPNSCDDKGAQVTVTFRPLLVKKSDAANLISSAGSDTLTSSDFNELPDLVMSRWNILNSSPVHADEIRKAYQNILTAPFIAKFQNILSNSWQTFKPVIGEEYPNNPFVAFNLVSKFAFLHNGTIGLNDSYHIQYYYDLFSDLAAAYKEFCLTGNEIISECCPDGSLFPRHLLLGEAIPAKFDAKSEFRHYFIYSPLFQRKEMIVELKFLFRRMVLMLKGFTLPPVTPSSSNDKKIVVTPSRLSDDAISEKAIPYYYKPDLSPLPLYESWSFFKSKRNRAKQNLSYNASVYTEDDFVENPLKYDLEPFNFFRIEGIIGKEIAGVTETIKKRIAEYRLPVKMVALATGEPGTGSQDENCCFLPDLQLQFRLLRNELLSCLEKNIKYWGSIQKKKDAAGKYFFQMNNLPLTYVGSYNPEYKITAGTILETEPFMLKAAEETAEGKPVVKIISGDESKETKRGFVWDEADVVKKDTIGSVYLDYKKIENIHMAGLPGPKTVNAVENIQHYVLILIDEMEAIIKLLESENAGDFEIEAFNRHVAALDKVCSKLGDLLGSYKKTDYLVEKMRLTLEGQTENVNTIADLMPVMSDDEASKITLLLANIEDVDAFIGKLRQNEGDYALQQDTIRSYYDKLDKDGMMVLIPKKPDSGFTSEYSPMLERLKSCKCNDALNKIVVLVQKYRDQLDRLRDINNFSVYTKEHPGIQHKAGVPEGGTFIVVYKGSNDKSEKIPVNTVIADFYLPYNCCSNCNPIEITFQEAPEPENQPPVARPGDNISIQLPEDSVTLDGSTSSDPDGTIKTYLWEQESEQEANIGNPNESVTVVSGLTEGSYTFKLTVTDNDGASDSETLTVTVLLPPNEPPVAVAAANPTTVVLSANGEGISLLSGDESSDSDGEIKSFEWSLSTGPANGAAIKDSDKVQTQVAFSKPGTYIFKLEVKDDDGATSSTAVIVTVVRENLPPVAKASAEPAELILVSGGQQTSKLNGNDSSDQGGVIIKYEWTIASGPTGGAILASQDKPETVATFSVPGTYEFKLVVADDQELEGSTLVTVKVIEEANEGPVAVAKANPASLKISPGQTVTAQLDGSGSSDPDGNIKSFHWKLTGNISGVQIDSQDTAKTSVQFSQPGNFSFLLTVTDDAGLTSTATASVSILRENIESSKICALLNEVIDSFNRISGEETDETLKTFTEKYPDFERINRFFIVMNSSNVANIPVIEQVKFLIKQKTEPQLQKWIGNLGSVLTESEQFGTLPLQTFSVLTRLAYFISCIQDQDINEADVKMITTLSTVVEILKRISPQTGNFSSGNKKIISELENFSNDERKRLKNNGEEAKKPVYAKVLDEILNAFKSMSL